MLTRLCLFLSLIIATCASPMDQLINQLDQAIKQTTKHSISESIDQSNKQSDNKPIDPIPCGAFGFDLSSLTTVDMNDESNYFRPCAFAVNCASKHFPNNQTNFCTRLRMDALWSYSNTFDPVRWTLLNQPVNETLFQTIMNSIISSSELINSSTKVIDQSVDRLNNQRIKQSLLQRSSSSTELSVDQSIEQSTHQPIEQSIKQSIVQSIEQSIVQSNDPSPHPDQMQTILSYETWSGFCVFHEPSKQTVNQTNIHSLDQIINQSNSESIKQHLPPYHTEISFVCDYTASTSRFVFRPPHYQPDDLSINQSINPSIKLSHDPSTNPKCHIQGTVFTRLVCSPAKHVDRSIDHSVIIVSSSVGGSVFLLVLILARFMFVRKRERSINQLNNQTNNASIQSYDQSNYQSFNQFIDQRPLSYQPVYLSDSTIDQSINQSEGGMNASLLVN